MRQERNSCVDLLRGGLSWPGVVVLWTGIWTLLDRHVPGGTGLWKEMGLAVVGAGVMVWTRTLFSNAGMDSLDYEGSLSEMGSLLAQGRLQWRDKAMFYARSFLAIVGSILFWDGVFTLFNEHAWESTTTYNVACASLGGAGTVWVMTSEDDPEPEDDFGYSTESSARAVRKAIAGQVTDTFAVLGLQEKAKLYAKALFCNLCSVVCWKGVEEIIEDLGPDSVWTGVVFFVVGISILAGTERLSSNSGLDDGMLEVEMQAPMGEESLFRWNTEQGFCKAESSKGLCSRGDGDDGGGCCCCCCSWWSWCDLRTKLRGGFFRGGRRRSWELPRWAKTAAELIGVVFAWTGIEWFTWDGDYISDTWLRDLLYVGVGLAIMIATGTFFNMAGTISPIAVLKQVHQHNRHEEARPLLSPRSDEALFRPATPR